MSQKIHIDFETRSKCDIWKSGAWVYSKDPSTKILCIAFAVGDGEVKLIRRIVFEPSHPTSKSEILFAYLHELADRSDTIFVAHNAFFEQSIWKNILVKYFKFPELPPERWVCSMAKASAFGVPRSLERAAKALQLGVEKNLDGKRIMMKLSKPRKPTKNNSAIWNEDIADFEKLYDYCIDDVIVEREIDKALPNLNKVEREVWLLDQKINMKGVLIDRDLAESALKIIGDYSFELNARLRFLTGGYVERVTMTMRVRDWMLSQGVETTDLQKATVIDLLKGTLPEPVREVLKIRQQLSKSSTKKFETILTSSDKDDNRIRDTLLYHGANTGRWTGKLVQVHNLPRGTMKTNELLHKVIKARDLNTIELLYPDIMGALSSSIRNCFIPKYNHEFIAMDYNAIEARVLFWLADCELGVSQFQKEEDLYLKMAEIIYGGSGYTKEKNPNERQLGKQAVLGCGYGMGSIKFAMTCQGYDMDVNEVLANRAVKSYRNTYPEVPNLWKAQEQAVKEALESGKIVTCSGIRWGVQGDFLLAILPSGRHIAYHYPDLKWEENQWGTMQKQISYMSVNSQTNSYLRTNTWGGKIVENLVQAIARDILAWAMLRLDNAGFDIVLTVHDEIVVEATKQVKINYVNRIMCQLPSWAKGLPLLAEGWRGKWYKK